MNNKPLNRSGPVMASELPDVVCPVCGCSYFQPTVHIKIIPATHPGNPTGKEQPMVHQVFCCMGVVQDNPFFSHKTARPCGHIIDMANQATYGVQPPSVPVPAPGQEPRGGDGGGGGGK